MPFVEHGGKRILFVHIPKTGGTTVENWMRSLGDLHFYSIGVPGALKCTPQHFTYKLITQLVGSSYFDYIFTIVRNPYQRMLSEYRMHAVRAEKEFFHRAPAFSLWLETALRTYQANPFAYDNHLRPQWEFVTEDVKIFRFEDGILQILSKVAADLGVPTPSQVGWDLDTRSGVDQTTKLDSHDQRTIESVYGKDFDVFGYDRSKWE